MGASRSDEDPTCAGVHQAISRSRENGDLGDSVAIRWRSGGDPVATRGAILTVVDADQPPLRIFSGKTPLDGVTRDLESRLATWNAWQPVEAYGS